MKSVQKSNNLNTKTKNYIKKERQKKIHIVRSVYQSGVFDMIIQFNKRYTPDV